MKKLILLSVLLAGSQLASAASSGIHIFMCKVVQFDKAEIKGQCDPYNPKNTYKIRREWISEDYDVKMNSRVKFALDEKQMGEWMTMNKMEFPKGKVK